MQSSSVQECAKRKRRLPGEVGVWLLIFGDLLVFAIFFCVFMFHRGQDVELYRRSQSALNRTFAVVNTFILLTSSLIVALAVRSVREGKRKTAPPLFTLAFLCGLAFAICKFLEYREEIHHGITLLINDFFMYYFIFTGIHLLHVLIGMAVLLFLRRLSGKETLRPIDISLVESGASYWHMVDLLWIVLFPLLYLVR